MKKRVTRTDEFFAYEFVLDKGEERLFDFPDGAQRALMDSTTLYTHGHFEVLDPKGRFVSERKPGEFTGARPDIKAGSYRLIARQDGSRMVCVQARERDNLFNSRAVMLARGESYPVARGHTLILCDGSIAFAVAGEDRYLPQQPGNVAAVVAQRNPVEIVAQDAVMALDLWRSG